MIYYDGIFSQITVLEKFFFWSATISKFCFHLVFFLFEGDNHCKSRKIWEGVARCFADDVEDDARF